MNGEKKSFGDGKFVYGVVGSDSFTAFEFDAGRRDLRVLFTEALDESQPKISRHLAYLRKAGLVETRREGKWMHYRINFPENRFARDVLYDTLEWLKSDEEMQEEYENLVDACCSVNVPITIAKAPKPEAIVEANTEVIKKEEIKIFLL